MTEKTKRDELIEQLSQKSTGTARTLHKVTSIKGAPAPDLQFAWFASSGMDYSFYPIKDEEMEKIITKALEDGTIVASGQYNYDYGTHSSGEKLILAGP